MAAAGAAFAMPGIARAQSYPTRPIRLVVLSTPGALGDIMSRILARHLEGILGQPVLVDNRPGAGGHLSHAAVAHSEPDGYTILFGANTVFAMGPVLFDSLPYQMSDLRPAGYFYSGMHWLLTNPSLGLNSVADFLAYAEANGADVNFGSPGQGHPMHVYTEQVQAGWGTRMTHVPYQGMPAAIQGLVTNDVQFLVTGVSDSIANVQAGNIQVLATSGPVIEGLAPPGTPRLEDTHPELAYNGWVGIFVQSQTPDEIVMALNAALNQLADDPDYIAEMARGGNAPMTGTPDEVAAHLARDMDEIGELVRSLNL